ncbi:Cysteine proteinase RD21a [Acorus calamus]|uniref:Cysteine proteinase RD21a n=1 Tax=Acorus calamus TaxID=4465 RepID=A0AAV9FLX3_ACOCL|nr:Cysteine proteinase RD21a [Acorus calamus]
MGQRRYNCILLLITFASILGLTVSTLNEFSIINYKGISEGRGLELFEQWAKKHGKVYGCMEEKEKRLLNFIENLHYVLENNIYVKDSGHQVGLNVFADMNNDEFKEIYTPKRIMKKKPKLGGERRASKVSCETPMSLDWRKKGVVTGVKNQGQCGSCWSFSSTGAMEGINAICTGDLISLSEQELIDCDTTNEGCDGGYMDYAFEWVINNGGIDSESDYPYTGLEGVCNVTKEEIKLVTIDGYEDVDPSEGALLCAVVKQPISVGIDGSSLDFQLYTGGIYDGDCSSNPNDIDHAVLIVGYGSQGSTDYWIVKNSWGTSWGMEGYIYIKRNTELPYGVCAINAMASYPTKQSYAPTPYPSPTIPPPPPPPPSPSPSQCGDFSFCPSDETCCCLVEFSNYCFVYGCCLYENAVCCANNIYCCPQDYPICDVEGGLCLQNSADKIGVAAKKRTLAKHKFPWTKSKETLNSDELLLWKS